MISKDHAIVGPSVDVSFNHFLTITEADFLLWNFQRCVENKMVTILPVPVCWYQKQQPVYRKGKSNISIKWNIMAKLQNTGPLLTMHQTSQLVWLVCSYTHINKLYLVLSSTTKPNKPVNIWTQHFRCIQIFPLPNEWIKVALHSVIASI